MYTFIFHTIYNLKLYCDSGLLIYKTCQTILFINQPWNSCTESFQQFFLQLFHDVYAHIYTMNNLQIYMETHKTITYYVQLVHSVSDSHTDHHTYDRHESLTAVILISRRCFLSDSFWSFLRCCSSCLRMRSWYLEFFRAVSACHERSSVASVLHADSDSSHCPNSVPCMGIELMKFNVSFHHSYRHIGDRQKPGARRQSLFLFDRLQGPF